MVGSNCTFSVAVWPGFKVAGKVDPDNENPAPVTVAELTITGAVPVEDRVTDCVAGVFSATSPNARLAALTLSVGMAAFNCRAKLFETPPALAVSVTACAELTEETVAVNPALVAFAGTVTVAGTVTAALLLARLTTKAPLAAAAVKVTVQASVPAPVIEVLLHEIALNAPAAGVLVMPVPLSPTTTVAPAKELLLTVS